MAGKTYSAGTIFLQVVPVFGDTMRKIQREAKDMNKVLGDEMEKGGKDAGERAGKAMGDGLEKHAKQSGEKAGENYAGAFQEKLKSNLRGAQREIDTLNFKTLSDDAEKRVARIKSLLKDLDGEIDVDMDDKKVRAKLDFLRADLKKLQEGKHELHIDHNIAEVVGKIEGGLKFIDKELDKRRVIAIETKISDRDLGSFERKLRDTAKRAAKSLGDSMDPQIRRLKSRLDALGDVEIGIDISSDAARAELISIDQELSRIDGKHVDVDLGVNAAVAHAELLAFRRALNEIDGKDVDIPIKVKGAATAAAETAAVGSSLNLLSRAFAAGGGNADSAANSFRSFNFVILAAVTLIPALIPMIGALGGGLLALIPILGAVGAGLGTMLLGFSGIGTAVSAMGDVQDNAAKDSLSASKTMAGAANAVADAERSLAEARRSAGQAAQDAARAVKDAKRAAAEAIKNALEQQKQAQEDYRDSVKEVAQAERDLAQARKDAAYELQDLDNQVSQNQIDIGQQTISVFEAQANFNNVMSDGSATQQERDAANLALQEAELRLKELREEQQRLAKDKAKADKEGVNGTDTVKNAQDALTQAIKDQQDAQEDLAKATKNVDKVRAESARRVADAERNLARTRAAGARSIADAERNLARARQQAATAADQLDLGSASVQKLNTAMDKLGPAGRKFARFIFSLREPFYKLRDAVQAALLPPMQHAIETIIGTYGPYIQKFAVDMAGTMGGLFDKQAQRMAKSPGWRAFLGTMAKVGPTLLQNFGSTMINFLQVFADVMTAVAPYAERLSFAMLHISQDALKWVESGKGLSFWQGFMDYAFRVGPDVIDFFVNTWKAAVNLVKALAPWGAMIMGLVSGLMAFIGAMDPKTLSLIVTGVLTLATAFQVAVGAVALYFGGAAIFARTASIAIFAAVALAGALATIYHNSETFQKVVKATTHWLSEHKDMLMQVAKAIGAVMLAMKVYRTTMAIARAVTIGFAAASYGAAGATYAQGAAGKFAYGVGKVYYGAQKVWTTITNLMTLANLKLAASFLANPIVLITLAIIALIAVFVILFKRNKTFHDLVIRVWGAIKTAAKATWDFIKAAFLAGAKAIQDVWTNYLQPVFSAMWTAIKFLWDHVWKPYLTLLWTFWSNAFKAIWWTIKNIFVPIIDLIAHIVVRLWKTYFKVYLALIKAEWKVVSTVLKAAWNHVIKPVIDALGRAIKWLWDNVVKPNLPKIEKAWNSMRDKIKNGYDKWIKPTINAFKTVLGDLKDKFDTVVGFIKTAWDGLKAVLAKPIVFIVDTVLNNGLIAGFNKIADFVGSKKMGTIPLSNDIRNAANPGGEKHARGGIFRRDQYATGGTLPGYTPGQDVHHFYSPSAGSLHLSGGEAIMRPEFTKALGSGWVDKMNMIARAEGATGVRRVLGGGRRYARGGVNRFASGGTWKPFWPEPGGVWSTYPGHDGIDLNAPGDNGPTGEGGVTSFYSATPGTVSYVGYDHGYGNATFISTPVGTLVYGHAYPGSTATRPGMKVQPGTYLGKVGMTGNASGPHLHFGFPGGTPSAALGVLSGAIHGDPHPGGGGGIHVPGWLKGFIKGPIDYIKGLVAKPINAFKDKFGDNGLVKSLASIPGKLVSAVADKALDIIPGPIKAAVKGAGAVAGAVGDAAGAVGDAIGLKTGGILPYNGTMKYDSGGYLPPGITSVVNLTGKPEPVFTHDQFKDMGGREGGEIFHYEPHFEGSDLTAGDVVRDMDHARRKMRREGRYARNR